MLRYVLVSGKTVEAAFPLITWAGALKDWGGPFPGERSTGFIAMLVPEDARELTFIDAGIAAQTIQLAASSRSWGCCIIVSFHHPKMQILLQVPQGYKIELMLGLGVAKEERRIAPLPPDSFIAYWRDAQQVYHVPKRALDDIIVGRFND